MYGKVMSISDEMMWRYYELLTDVRMDAIAQIKADAASGKAHPMALKKELARSIVADFHSAEEARKAAEDWARTIPERSGAGRNRDGVSGFSPRLRIAKGDSLRLAKVLVKIGFAPSTSEADRKIKEARSAWMV